MSGVCATLAFECTLLAACSANDDVPAPRVSNVVPSHAASGALVTLNGDYFCQRPAMIEDPVCDTVGDVHFGSVPGTPTTWMDTTINVEVPAGITGQVDVTVTARGRSSNAVSFTAD